MNAIETRALTRRYKSVTAVDALELTVAQGELFALLGVNGAGKTTAIRMLTGLTRPTSGDALILGHSVVTDTRAAKALTGVSPQETAVAPRLTVRENLELMRGLYGLGGRREEAERMMARLGLADCASRYAGELSGGWQRRLSIAMALITEPKVLFLDEPTLGLDVLARRELWEVIRGLRGHVTTVLTTHYLEEAEALSHRIGILVKGRLAAAGTAAELQALAGAETFEDAFVKLAGGEDE